MSFDWAGYLDLAGELCAAAGPASGDEARHRSTISRAYYAAFHRARAHLRDRDGDKGIPKGAAAHSYVRWKFAGSADRRRTRIGMSLNHLRQERNRADYDEQMPGLHAKSAVALKLATQVIEDLKRL